MSQFPAVLYEPLEQHYLWLHCLGGLSEDFISDLCAHYTWRGIVAAALLAALAPDVRYRPYLATAYEQVPHNQWLIGLALAEIEHTEWRVDPDFQAAVRRLRAQLQPLHKPVPVLRQKPADGPQVESIRTLLKSAYHGGGLEASRQILKKSGVQ